MRRALCLRLIVRRKGLFSSLRLASTPRLPPPPSLTPVPAGRKRPSDTQRGLVMASRRGSASFLIVVLTAVVLLAGIATTAVIMRTPSDGRASGASDVYLVRRGWRYYGSLGRDGRVRCGGCGSCATPKSELRKGQGVRGMGQGEEASGQRSEVRN